MKKKHFLTAEECLAFGFADEIVEDIELEEETQEEESAKNQLLAKYAAQIQPQPEVKMNMTIQQLKVWNTIQKYWKVS